MTINGIHGADTQMGQMGMNRTADSYSRSIQKQIANAQKQLQELSSNENMTLEDKIANTLFTKINYLVSIIIIDFKRIITGIVKESQFLSVR